MKIHIVKPGDSLNSIANLYNVSADRIIIDNEIHDPNFLVIGQSIVILFPNTIYIVQSGDTLIGIAENFNIDVLQILRNNPIINEMEVLIPGQEIVIDYKTGVEFGGGKIATVELNGYAYPFIDRTILRKTLPFLTYLSIFNYGFTPDGELIPPMLPDDEIIAIAIDYKVAPIMVLAPMTAAGNFSNELAHAMLNNPIAVNNLINNIVDNIKTKNYYGVDIDFEFILPEDKDLFIDFIRKTRDRLTAEGLITMVALAPKSFKEQPGLLYESHDYEAIGAIADRVLLMTYEWGYAYGPPMATSPYNLVKIVLNYGVSAIDPAIIYMGIPNYAYDWPLPFMQGETVAENIGNVEAVERAKIFGSFIQFDEVSQSPFYNYISLDGTQHVVWFDDGRSMNSKLRLINEYNLIGGGYWQIMRYFPQNWLVVNSIFDIVKKL